MVAGVYPSHIGFKNIITVEVMLGPERSNGRIHRQVNPL